MKPPKPRTLALLAAAAAIAALARFGGERVAPAAEAGQELSRLVVPPAHAATRAASAPARDAAALDLAAIGRRVDTLTPQADAFASRSWVRPPPPAPPPPPPPPPEPPPPPQAPPLPFKYLGKLEQAQGRTEWYLGQGDKLIVAADGDTIDGLYRIEGQSGASLALVYLPLEMRQLLPIGAPP
jgi:hypothetical protein